MNRPPVSHRHDEYDALAVAWAIDALDGDDQHRFEHHLAGGCPLCAESAAAALDVAAELAFAVRPVEPPAALRGRILAVATQPPGAPPPIPPIRRTALRLLEPPDRPPTNRPPQDRSQADAPSPAPSTESGTSSRRTQIRWIPAGRHRALEPRRLVFLVAAACVVAVVAVGAVGSWQLAARVHRPTVSATASADRVAMLKATTGGQTMATVVLSPARAEIITALSFNTAGRTSYVLWGLPGNRGAAATALGTFDVTAAGPPIHPVRLLHPIEGYQALAISEEAAGTLPATPSKVLARGTITR